jgi:hypothetical protein
MATLLPGSTVRASSDERHSVAKISRDFEKNRRGTEWVAKGLDAGAKGSTNSLKTLLVVTAA